MSAREDGDEIIRAALDPHKECDFATLRQAIDRALQANETEALEVLLKDIVGRCADKSPKEVAAMFGLAREPEYVTETVNGYKQLLDLE